MKRSLLPAESVEVMKTRIEELLRYKHFDTYSLYHKWGKYLSWPVIPKILRQLRCGHISANKGTIPILVWRNRITSCIHTVPHYCRDKYTTDPRPYTFNGWCTPVPEAGSRSSTLYNLSVLM